MKIIRATSFLALLALFALADSLIAQPAAISWPDAVGKIAGERAKAEACVALMKKYGDNAQKARGQITYTNAKADFDAVIAGLITVLSARQTPASLSSLQEKLSSGASGLSQFCGTVINLLPKTAGQTEKGVGIDILKAIPLGQLLMLSDGVSALYTNHRSDDAMACIFRGQGSSIASVLLLAQLFVVVPSPAALAQLFEQPVLIIDPGRHTAPIRDIGVDAAGRIAVTGGLDKTLRIWSLTEGTLLRTIRMPAGPGDIGKIYAVAVRPDGALVAAGGWTRWTFFAPEESIYVFETLTGKMAARIAGLRVPTLSLAFSLDGRYLAVGLLGRGGLHVYDQHRQWSEVFRDTDYGDDINGVTFSADGRLAATSYDGKVRLYDRAFRLVVPPKQVTGGREPFRIAFSPDGTLLAVGYNDAPAVDLLDGHSLAPLPRPNVDGLNNGSLSVVTWSRDGRTLYAGGQYEEGSTRPILVWANPGLRRALQASLDRSRAWRHGRRYCRMVGS